MTTLTAVTFNEERTGEQRRVIVGRIFDGLKVLAIASAGGNVSVVMEGGDMREIPAGSIVQVRETGMPAPAPRAPSAQKKLKADPRDPLGPVRSITYSNGIDHRTVTVGSAIDGPDGRPRMVVKIVSGDPVSIVGLNDDVLLQIGAGSVSRWA